MHLPEWMERRADRQLDELELGAVCRLQAQEVSELVEYGALVPVATGAGAPRMFSAAVVAPLREAVRLRQDFDLDLFSAALLLRYLERIAELEQRVRTLEAHVPHGAHASRDAPQSWHEPHA